MIKQNHTEYIYMDTLKSSYKRLHAYFPILWIITFNTSYLIWNHHSILMIILN